MEQFFTSLSKRQTMLLLTALSFGGGDAIAAFEHLLPEEEELLKHRAQGLLQIPRDRRVPLLVQEIKRLFTQRRRVLAAADPARLAELLSRERPAMVEVMLRALPSELADAVRARLPGGPPRVTLGKEVKPEVLSIIRWKLEEAMKKRQPQVGTFRFTDLLTLQQREVMAICDRMGARVLATAIAGLQDEDREAFMTALPPDQRTLAAKAAEAGKVKRLSVTDAALVLDMHDAISNPSLGLRSAGVQRLARACVAQGPEFGPRLVERFPGELGKVLGAWLKEEKNRPVKGDGGRVDIVEQMERLAQRGIMDRPMRLPPPAPLARLAGKPPEPAQAGLAPAAPPAALKAPPPPLSRGPLETIPTGQAAPRVAAPSAFMPTPRISGGGDQDVAAPEPGGSRVISMAGQPPPRRPTAQVARPTSGIPARRDPVAERAARKAGASGTGQSPALAPQARAAERTDPDRPAIKRVLRDGKPLEGQVAAAPPGDTLPPRRATAAPVVQGIPRRKERPAPANPAVPKGPGRGPGSGSR